MMKYLRRVLVYIPDQVLSTFVIWAGIFVWYRGFKDIIANPPSPQTMLVVIFIGVAFGLLTARPTNEKHIEAPKVDR